ncbi:MAG: tRNA dihydrouridine synthase DusB, partial [Geobacter sp.]|nr:tRNA dihydrouridine synthase DusB [Geobacter sp.]
VRKATSLPLTVKIRSGWGYDAINYLLVGQIAADEGADGVTLHPRTRAQMFEGRSDWQQIAALKKALAIPVIGSGDLFTPADIVKMFAETGCDAVMAARGAMGNPWIFSGARALLAGLPQPEITMAARRAVAMDHLHLLAADAGEAITVREMRKHLCWYAKGVAGAAQFRGEVNRMDSMEEMELAINTFFSRDVDES